jgi:hypothetical protein
MLVEWIVKKVSQVFNSNPQDSRVSGQPKKDGGTVHKQILINEKLKTIIGGQKTVLTGRNPFRRQRFTLDCGVI